MERYLFFNSAVGDRREYKAQDFAEYFGSVLSSGLLHTDKNPNLVVSVEPGTMNTVVTPGTALIKGHLYENTTPLTLTHSIPEPTMDRIDRIVLRLDLKNQSRYIRLFVKEGESANNPIAPSLQRDAFVQELSLAQIKVRKNTVQLLASDIVDERLDEGLCGLVYSLISIPSDQLQNWITARIAELEIEADKGLADYLQAVAIAEDALQTAMTQHLSNAQGLYDNYSSQLQIKLNQFETDFNTWFNNLKEQLDKNVALSLQNQINILNDSLDATEQSLAAHLADDASHGIGDKATLLTTEKTSIVGAMNELFTNVSNGKQLVGTAITDVDDSLVVPTNPTFDNLAELIGKISTGKRWANGTVTSGSSIEYYSLVNGDTAQAYPVVVSGLSFKPSFIFLVSSSVGQVILYNENNYDGYRYNTVKTFRFNNGISSNQANYNFQGDRSPAYVTNNGFKLPSTNFGNTSYTWLAFE